ncbi:hypothetical protein APICC_06172 [Apis cerana cerana]|uniref:Uncharacterized protein n=2 Tax=Apis cerana TaxID=7461 RepID=A0A2A3EGE1_APICC|nr:hypothetical protein APICC_06172 [Apis cerana cerana]
MTGGSASTATFVAEWSWVLSSVIVDPCAAGWYHVGYNDRKEIVDLILKAHTRCSVASKQRKRFSIEESSNS